MIRLIIFFLVFAIFLAFIVFNLEYKCDVSIGFITFREIPVFLTASFSFALGMLFSIPVVLLVFGKKKKKPPLSESGGKAKDDPPETLKKIDSSYGID